VSRLLQLCSFFSPDGADENAEAAVITTRLNHKEALQQHQRDMAKSESERKVLQAQADAGFPDAEDEAERKKQKDRLKRLNDKKPVDEAKERGLVSRGKYFEEVLKQLQQLDKRETECPMCLETLVSESCMITSCGHFFCRACILEAVRSLNHCPSCRQELQPKNLQPATEVLSLATEAHIAEGSVAKFGSKLSAVCRKLEDIWGREPEAKVIIFVQFEVLLNKLAGALKELKLPCQLLQGSVFERRKTIRLFQTPGPDHRVLLLSLEKCPTGMNLVCCHHLILVHPMMANSREAALSYERQAIGRVRRRGQQETVHVYRFFTRETVEEKLTFQHHQELYNGIGGEQAASSSGEVGPGTGASSSSGSGSGSGSGGAGTGKSASSSSGSGAGAGV